MSTLFSDVTCRPRPNWCTLLDITLILVRIETTPPHTVSETTHQQIRITTMLTYKQKHQHILRGIAVRILFRTK